MKIVGLAIVFVWFAVGGAYHFINPEFFVRIVPPYIPWPVAAVYVSGAFELLGAVGILVPRWRRLAGIGLFVLTICVTPANVYMWMNPDLFPQISESVLGFRLVLQIGLLACIWWSTRGPTAREASSELAR